MKELSQFWYFSNTQKDKEMFTKETQRMYSKYLREERFLIQLSKNDTIISSKFHNFLTLKRHIDTMRFYSVKETLRGSIRRFTQRKNYKKKIDTARFDNSIHLSMILLSLPLELCGKRSTKYKLQTLPDFNVYRSFHSAFSCLEKKWNSCCSTLEAEVPSYLHPEVLVRMLNAHCKDVSFIDLLRRNFYIKSIHLEHPSIYIQLNISKYLTNILWNLWIWEFEKFIVNEFELLSDFNRSQNLYRNTSSFVRKAHFLPFHTTANSLNLDKDIFRDIPIRSSFLNTKCFFPKNCNYLRYTNSSIIGMESNMLLIQLLKRRCTRFWKYRIGIFLKSSRLDHINLHKEYSWFLGSVFHIQSNAIKMKAMTVNNLLLPITFWQNQILLLTIPVASLTKLLSEYGFCKKNGYPVSKSNWSILPDSKIIERFSQILISINCHYSGCVNKKALGYLQYILSFSCGKTLACKHKTNLRSIWNTYTNELTHNHLFLKKKNIPLLSLSHQTSKKLIKQKHIAVWDLNNIHPDPMVLYFISKADNKRTIFYIS